MVASGDVKMKDTGEFVVLHSCVVLTLLRQLFMSGLLAVLFIALVASCFEVALW